MESYRGRSVKKRAAILQKKRKRRRWIILLIILLILLAAVLAVLFMVNRLSQIESHPLEGLTVNTDIHDPNMKDYTNIMVFGVDSRANDLKEDTRSDSIMLVSINNKNHDVKITSIYRDTYVNIDGHGNTKINHAYSFGGPELAVNTVNRNFDLNVTDFVTVNFSALSNVIDALGGITLNIHKNEKKWVNAYARDVARINGTSFTKIKKAGKQTVTGAQATGYCRVRYTAGGDFTRAKRQRTVLKAIMAKAKRSNPVTLYRVMDEMLPQIYTSLTTNDILKLAVWLPFYDIQTSKGFPYQLDCHRASDGIYYDFPVTLSENVTKLHKRLFGTKHYQPSPAVEEISSVIENGG